MLVASISYVPPRTISAAIAEAVTARDATATAGSVFVTLVDDPTAVVDLVDAYLGEIMIEAASAADTASAGSVYAVMVDEAATAMDAPAATVPVAAARAAMLAGVFVNSVGTSREANADGVMVNL